MSRLYTDEAFDKLFHSGVDMTASHFEHPNNALTRYSEMTILDWR